LIKACSTQSCKSSISGIFFPTFSSVNSIAKSVIFSTSVKSFHPAASIAFLIASSILALSNVAIAQFLFFTLKKAINPLFKKINLTQYLVFYFELNILYIVFSFFQIFFLVFIIDFFIFYFSKLF
jgi:hypothetical protein